MVVRNTYQAQGKVKGRYRYRQPSVVSKRAAYNGYLHSEGSRGGKVDFLGDLSRENPADRLFTPGNGVTPRVQVICRGARSLQRLNQAIWGQIGAFFHSSAAMTTFPREFSYLFWTPGQSCYSATCELLK